MDNDLIQKITQPVSGLTLLSMSIVCSLSVSKLTSHHLEISTVSRPDGPVLLTLCQLAVQLNSFVSFVLYLINNTRALCELVFIML